VLNLRKCGGSIDDYVVRKHKNRLSPAIFQKCPVVWGNPSISVSKNKFYGDPFVEPDGKIVNIDFSNMKNAQIYFNDMDSELFGLLNNVTGVLTEGSQNIRIDCNKMLGRETDVSTAFMIKNTTGVSLTDNITSFTSEGIHFSGVCKTGDNGVRFNSLYHHDYGLTYDADASTDEQNNGPNSNVMSH
jgi:hypothetical protein